MPRSQYLLPGFFLLATLASCNDPTTTEPEEPQVTEPGFATVATALSFYQVSAGQAHTCGLTLDGRLYCWGSNAFGELGDGTSTNRLRPVAVAGALRFRQVSAGYWHTCGVTTDYRAYCWGANEDRGTLGDGTETNRRTPVLVAGGHRFRLVEGGSDHTCGVSYPDNQAYCWGYGAEGALGDGAPGPRLHLTPVAVLGGHRFRQVAAGLDHTCGVTTSNQAFCWGVNKYGQVGDSVHSGGRVTPTRVAGKHQFRQVDAGAEFSCGVTTSFKAFCWGNGRQGQIGDGKPYLRFWPRAVAGGLSLERVSTGEMHACAETTNNRVYCWGSNSYGQLGDGTLTQRMTPVTVLAGGRFFNQVSAGGQHTCARTDTAVGYCWGLNLGGQLGDSTRTSRTRPVRIVGPA